MGSALNRGIMYCIDLYWFIEISTKLSRYLDRGMIKVQVNLAFHTHIH